MVPEHLVSKIRSCNVACLLVVSTQFVLSCILAHVRGVKGSWCLAWQVVAVGSASAELAWLRCGMLEQKLSKAAKAVFLHNMKDWLQFVHLYYRNGSQSSYMLHAYLVNRCCTLQQCWDNVYFVPTSGKNKYVSFCSFACLPSWFATTFVTGPWMPGCWQCNGKPEAEFMVRVNCKSSWFSEYDQDVCFF